MLKMKEFLLIFTILAINLLIGNVSSSESTPDSHSKHNSSSDSAANGSDSDSSNASTEARNTKSLHFGPTTKQKRYAERRISNGGGGGGPSAGGYANFYSSPSFVNNKQFETIDHNQVTSPHDHVKNNYNHWENNQYHHGYYGSQPQYIEAPEPIIEIIIKESNETLPTPAALVSEPPKKKKEEVQVYYVKYKHDEHKGLQVDAPIPALSPIGPGDEEHEHHAQADDPIIVTLPPPLKTTTLRAIIHPESEKFHTHGNVKISFGGGDERHDSARQITEYNNEETALQPIVAHPNSPNSVANFAQKDQPRANNFISSPQLPPPQRQPVNFHPRPQVSHQGPPPPPQQQQFPQLQQQVNQPPPFNPNQQTFQFPQSGPPRQPQFFENRPQRFPPRFQNPSAPPKKVAFPEQRFPPPQQQQQHQQPQPHQHRPIPIPIQHFQQPQVNFQQNFQQQQQHQQLQPPQQIQHTQFNRPQHQQPIRPTKNVPFRPPPPQPTGQTSSVHQGLVQQPAPNLAGQNPQSHEHHQNLQYVLPAGGEVVASIPQFEQHITETVNTGLVRHPPPPPPQQDNRLEEQNIRDQQYQQEQHRLRQEQRLQHERIQQEQRLQHDQRLHEQRVQEQNQRLQEQRIQDQRLQEQRIQDQRLQDQRLQEQRIQDQRLQDQRIQDQRIQDQRIQDQRVQDQRIQDQRIQDQRLQDQHFHDQRFQDQRLHEQRLHEQRLYEQRLQEKRQHEQRLQDQQRFGQTASPNIGPLANTIGHLSVTPAPHKSVIREEAPLLHQYSSSLYNPHAEAPLAIPDERERIPIVHHERPTALPLIDQRNVFAQGPPPPRKGPHSVSNRFQDLFGNPQQNQHHVFPTNHKPDIVNIPQISRSTTTTTTTPRPTQAPRTESTTKKSFNVVLPDEVPDDLRQQLLSSGILENADISVLDYDKIGDTSLQDLPPEHLANFFNAGGAAQIGAAGSDAIETIVKPNGEKVAVQYAQPAKPKYRTPEKPVLAKKANVDLKVVRFDSQKSQTLEKYIDPEATVLPAVEAGAEQAYNRYLPLKIAGAHFPIPDVPELKGRRITEVVVLAPVDSPVDGDASKETDRFERDAILDSKQIKFIAGDALKQLIKKPSTENYKRWLEKEGKTDVDLQSVVLLVTKNDEQEQEIFMYDIATKAVSKLSGELSSAFVKVAESNATAQDLDGAPISDSGIVEQIPNKDTGDNEDETTTTVGPTSGEDMMEDMTMEGSEDMDSTAEGSEPVATFVKPEIDSVKAEAAKNAPYENKIMISSGYSVIKS